MARSIRFVCVLSVLLVGISGAAYGAGPLFISEFLAANQRGLLDEDGEASDWIEIFNSGTNSVNVSGWFLTDSAGNLTKWQFPSRTVPPGGFLVVFASGKNRAFPSGPLHANFSLNAAGEYLALVHPDGFTVASEFAARFPEQFDDISYGIGQHLQVTQIVSNSSPAKVLVPADGATGADWTAPGFNDSSWLAGTNGVGYETYLPGFAIRNFKANTTVASIDTAESVIITPSLRSGVFSENRGVVNYLNTGGGAHFPGDATFPGLTINVDADDFVLEATGILTIPTSGAWTFGVNSDDGFRAHIGTNTFSFPTPRGPADTFATFNLTAGEYPVRLVFYERGGGSEVEFFAASGTHSSFTASFRLVGDTAGGGLPVKSLPVSGGGGASLRSLIHTDVQAQMAGRSSSAYVRIPFHLADPSAFSSLTLRMKYDDGFVAYLNGTEIARRNAPAMPQWNSTAASNRPGTNALAFEDIGVSAALNLLVAGNNVLAIHALNDSANSADFLIAAEMVENRVLGLTNHYFSTPSPGAINGSGFYAFVENLKFSPGRGWFDSTNVSVTITSATPGISIRFTTNGTAPSPTNGVLYSGSIPISGTTLLRAVGYREGFEPTAAETHSYIFLNQVQAQSTNGNWAGGSSGNYTLATNITLHPLYRDTFKSDLLSIPTLSIAMAPQDLFGPSGVWSNPQGQGVAWERPCSLEYIRPDGERGFHINCGIRIQGGASRNLVPKHGLRVLFKSIYGASKLEYPLYSDSPVQEFDTLTLHATFNDHWLWGGTAATMQRDQWCRDTQNAMGGFGPHGTYVHLYLNGLYWGLYNIGEKGDASYAAHYLGGEKEEYDALNSDELIDGNRAAWDAMLAIANAGITTDAAYTNLSQYLNIPNFINYLLVNFYPATTDWPWHNWNAARRRVPGAGFHFFSWDAEWSFGIGGNINSDRTGIGATSDGSPGKLYAGLRLHPEFRRLFGDIAQKHLFNGGALTPGPAQARWMKRSAEIDRAVVNESARWGNGHTRQTWLSAQASVLSWFPQRTGILINQLRNAGLYPQLNAPAFSKFGGLVPPSYPLALTNANASGSIYFTTDGSDPRLWGGALSSSARSYTGLLILDNATFVRARVRDGTNWSALAETTFYIVQDFAPLKVTEIMYNPPNFGGINGDELEFIELKNTGTSALDLSGLQFIDGITFTFTNGTRLAPGAFVLLARNREAFAAKYPGVTISGVYLGKLDDAGERLTLAPSLGANAFSFSFDNEAPWPIMPDGYGFSLVLQNAEADPDSPAAWRPSAHHGGSPGADDPPSSNPAVVINEILTHTDPPQLDAIELHNPTAVAADLSGWFLSDDPRQPKKFRVPAGTTVPAGGFVVFDERHFNAQPVMLPSFGLSSHGEALFLFSGDAATNLTGYSHSFEYGAAANGVSFGRYVTSDGKEHWPAMVAVTLASANAAPRIGPLVINEVMYHPPVGYDEFVEIHNFGASDVSLADPAFPANRWRLSGLGYTFSNNVSIPAGGFLLLVPMDPDLFRTKYSVAASVQIIGPYPGTLQDSGERLRLERPDAPDTNGLPYIVVDEVRYNDRSPWPVSADGDGPSLQRREPGAYGNEPTNWFASGITPGAANVFNQSPVAAITSPANASVFDLPAMVNVAVSALDPDGFITQVEVYDGDSLIGIVTNAPFVFAWSNTPAGAHTLVAKARDNALAVGVSAPVTITVNPPPVGSGIGLRGDYFDNIDFTGGRIRRVDAVVNFNWGAAAPDPSMGADSFSVRWTGQVQPRFSEAYTFYTRTDDGVRLWVNNQPLVDRWLSQSATEWSGIISLQAGQFYDIRMEYFENGGDAVAQLFWSAPSVPKEIVPSAQLYPPASSNLPPAVALALPASNGIFVATSTVDLAAIATDPDGAIYKVEFFAGNTKLGEDTTSPFAFAWQNVPAGAHALRAIATDDSGISRTSAPVNITVLAGFTRTFTLISTGAVWKYLDNGSDQGAAWREIGFDDAAWSSGPAQLGYGDGDERTLIGFGPNGSAKYITSYFRGFFTVSDPAAFSALNLRVLRDDGVVVYLNGSEVYRDNMPGGVVSYQTLASANIAGADESTFYAAPISPGFLVAGANVVAVEIHQNAGTSADVSFDLELAGTQSYLAPTITAQPLDQTVIAGTDVIFSAVAAGTSPLSYQWRFNGTNLPGATNALLAFPNAQPSHVGNYFLIVTNIAGSITSAVATLTLSTSADSDGDGMPDAWENAHGLDPRSPLDALGDNDNDGMTNLSEYHAGTDPRDAASVLKLRLLSTNPIRLEFLAQTGLSYSVLYQTSLTAAPWFTLTNVPAPSVTRTIEVGDPGALSNGARFYRVMAPVPRAAP